MLDGNFFISVAKMILSVTSLSSVEEFQIQFCLVQEYRMSYNEGIALASPNGFRLVHCLPK